MRVVSFSLRSFYVRILHTNSGLFFIIISIDRCLGKINFTNLKYREVGTCFTTGLFRFSVPIENETSGRFSTFTVF